MFTSLIAARPCSEMVLSSQNPTVPSIIVLLRPCRPGPGEEQNTGRSVGEGRCRGREWALLGRIWRECCPVGSEGSKQPPGCLLGCTQSGGGAAQWVVLKPAPASYASFCLVSGHFQKCWKVIFCYLGIKNKIHKVFRSHKRGGKKLCWDPAGASFSLFITSITLKSVMEGNEEQCVSVGWDYRHMSINHLHRILSRRILSLLSGSTGLWLRLRGAPWSAFLTCTFHL